MSRLRDCFVILGVLGVVWAGGLGAAAAAPDPDAEKAAAAFDSLYGADLKAARASRDPADDLALAKRLLADAGLAGEQHALLALLCERVYELAAPLADGANLAVEAMDLLSAMAPERAASCPERIVDIRQKQFDTAKGDGRAEIGDTLVDAILAAAHGKVGGGDYAAALTLTRRAQAVARKVESRRRDEIDVLLKNLAADLRFVREAETLRASLDKDPDNTAVRERLVRLYLIDLDRPADAAAYVAGVADADLKKYVPAAAKGLEASPPELVCLDLGDWYRRLGDTSSADAKAAMYLRSKAYYERFVELHPDEDLKRTQALLALKKVDDALEKAGGRPAEPTEFGRGRWVDLLPLVNPVTDAVKGSWRRGPDGLTGEVRRPQVAVLMLPVIPDGDSYELEARVTRLTGGNDVVFTLPVGGTAASVLLNTGDNTAGLELIDEKRFGTNGTAVPCKLENGRPYAVSIQVMRQGDQASFQVALDGKRLFQWQGAVKSLTTNGYWTVPDPSHLGLAMYQSAFKFDFLRLRMLSGRVKVAHGTTPPAAIKPGNWTDLLALADPAKDGDWSGRWTRTAGGIAPVKGKGVAHLDLPVCPVGDYELEVKVVRQEEGGPTIGLVLPAADRDLVLVLWAKGEAGLAAHKDKWIGRGNETTVKIPELRPGAACTINVQVHAKGDALAVSVTLDNRPLISWNGSLSDMRTPDSWVTAVVGRLGLVTEEGQTLFTSVRLRMLSGEARLTR